MEPYLWFEEKIARHAPGGKAVNNVGRNPQLPRRLAAL
jgi:hypothetical protein